ncbi:uncharacterized protein A1O9_09275 [Exophiala aquamarina CBS 119918]|uniref:Tachykinin family protein n=1 Tax=Exophiala aquamarina CBS 119918 TaxID=1182545 RepID=A0A072P6D9_9EURO|nr:uncharacterized protein A1O9_09275 [Exophiala aquamarina CBS 119918]KEF54833.1 hypothetical protein A1O9_09275 [Exophiala aquamarina CBS 119918]
MNSLLIVVGPHQGLTTKEEELQASDARSHAATVSHARRKSKYPASQEDTDNDSAIKINFRKPLAHEPFWPGEDHIRKRDNLRHLGRQSARCREFAASTSLPHPITILGQSKLDPFNADSSRNLPPIAYSSLEHSYLNLWPKFDPAMTKAAREAVITHWRKTAVQSPLTFHAQISNAVSLCYVLSTDPSAMSNLLQIRWKHQAITMKIIRKKLEEIKGPVSDDLLENIMRIMSQGGDLYDGPATLSRYPETPLAEALHLKLYARFEMGLPHFRAIVELIKQRGGLENISTNFSRPIGLSDVIVSTKQGIRPVFPVLQELRQFSDLHEFTFDAKGEELMLEMRTGWCTSVLQNSHPDIVKLAIRAAQLTVALGQNHRAGEGHLSLPVICALTTVFQHDLNELNPQEIRVPKEHHNDMFDACRLGIQIFSDLILFPTAQSFSAKPRLITDLRRILTAYHLSEEGAMGNSDPNSRLLLWITFMGTVISEGTGHRDWYLRKLLYLVRKMSLQSESWTVFKGILVTFLWWDYVLEDHARDIWGYLWAMDTISPSLPLIKRRVRPNEGLNLGT